jgi:tRNA (guanosine-2'-O-)-methyltransferase
VGDLRDVRDVRDVRRFATALLFLLTPPLLSCIDDALGAQARYAIDARDIVIPDGAGLETACTPTGVEICFDARDNNCNGVIDEGCGIHTGLLQFVIAWEAAQVDVDLNVIDPNDETARVGQTTTAGLTKDRDCPGTAGADCQGQNVENVYLTEGEPRRGKYKVIVHLEKLNGATAPVRVRLGMRIGPRTFGRTVELSPGPGTEDKEFPFELK